MIRAVIADMIRRDNGRCVECEERRGSTWVLTWRISALRHILFPEIERRCYDCGIDHETTEGWV